VWYPRWFWPSFALPGVAWMAALFLLPFYVVLAIAFGATDPFFRTPVPIWNPLLWDPTQLLDVLGNIFGSGGFLGPPVVRTVVYVAAAAALCLLIGYPVAYFVARYGGRRKALFLVLLIAPFWISYMMRMLAWVNLLASDGLINRVLTGLGLIAQPVGWLEGRPLTVVLGLVYGYVPYMVLPLFAALDRIDTRLLEAARDLGASRLRTFTRVTMPLSRPAILTGLIIVTLPMSGDYFTNDLLSASPRTSMFGNLINEAVTSPGRAGQGAALVLLLLAALIPAMLWYVLSTGRSERRAA
jgi:spermidine/putrescine transport system permease protein